MKSTRVESGIKVTGFGGLVSPAVYRSPAGRVELVSAAAGQVMRWNVESGALLTEFELTEEASADYWEPVPLTLPDGRMRMGVAGDEYGFCLWDGESGRLLGDAVGDDRIYEVAAGVQSDGRPVFVGAGVHGLHLWDAVTGQPLTRPLDHVEPVAVTVATLTDGRSLIVTGDSQGVQRWQGDLCEVPGGAEIDAPYIRTLATAYMQDGRALIVAVAEDDEVVRRWDAETGEEIGVPIPTQGDYMRIAVAAVSGRMRLFTADRDAVRQWDLLSGEPLGRTFAGSYVSAVSLPDGSAFLAAGTNNGELFAHHVI
ncbi:WD40 repeat domain-containing protein [Streptomyces sp. NPDC089424]|uniref:WD40 repeat domain-containing protein n=1 Tax=Streptomyces sp. NPDC089424 TaxID=3365917 RepID=UPI003809AABA